jgi:ATP-dependent protease ClpP protease subunit
MPKWNLPRLTESPNQTPKSEEGDVINPEFLFQPNFPQSSINNNRIYFYGEVSKDSILTLNKQLDETARQLRVFQVNYDMAVPPPIRLYIQSDGGDLIAALSTLSRLVELKERGFEVHTIVEGMAASAATLISCGGSHRYIRRHAYMLIHQLRSGFWGTYAEFQDETENINKLMDQIRLIYKQYSKFRGKQLEGILKRDLYLSSEECLKMGLVDGIL